ncbi:hypothetical protein B0T10DRAFT_132468 [Thelonectria olida]|uniref:Zinc finger protein n=1 Tax=Thelonectria olida TaxID=1576542 RepID=A0A9P8VXU4_9HYPO|nr:hypothetical protein B0T10DRAFT_132468 [Thelonectria olida]
MGRPVTDPVDDQDIDAVFQTDDQTLEELLGDVRPDEAFSIDQQDDEKVKALLEELAQSIPKDTDDGDDGEKKDIVDSDDSEDEGMKREVDDVLARFRDELELEGAQDDEEEPQREEQGASDAETKPSDADKPLPSVESDPASFSLPDLPPDLADLPPPPKSTRASSTDLDSITARMAALRHSSPSLNLNLPDVPAGLPSKKKPASSAGFKRLTSRTNYTDDDVDSWCTVCLEDATLRCLGCDDDVYCARCWRDMHVGPAAGFDERSHRAVQFTRDKKTEKRKVAIGA